MDSRSRLSGFLSPNSGDTDFDYKTRFIGASSDTKLNADLIDTVTYGIELGVAAS